MTNHELQSWLDSASASSTPLQNIVAQDIAARTNGTPELSPLDDTFGWGARFEQMRKNKTLDVLGGLLLTGPSGCGKNTAAAHIFRLLEPTHCLLHLNGRELCSDGYGPATQRMRYALDNPANGYPWLLILENLEDCDCRLELLTWLGQVVDATVYACGDQPSLFVILIDSCGEDIPSILRRHLRLCRMAPPTASQRKAYFEKKQFPMIQHAVSVKLLVDATEGLTYAQLVDLAQNLECNLYCLPRDQASFSDEELLEFLHQQIPAPSLDNPLQSLAQSARQFIEQLPDLLSHLGTGIVSNPIPTPPVPTTVPTPSPNGKETREEMRKKIQEEPVKEVADNLMGSSRIAELEAIHKSRQRG